MPRGGLTDATRHPFRSPIPPQAGALGVPDRARQPAQPLAERPLGIPAVRSRAVATSAAGRRRVRPLGRAGARASPVRDPVRRRRTPGPALPTSFCAARASASARRPRRARSCACCFSAALAAFQARAPARGSRRPRRRRRADAAAPSCRSAPGRRRRCRRGRPGRARRSRRGTAPATADRRALRAARRGCPSSTASMSSALSSTR